MPLALLSLQKYYYPLYYRMNLTSIYGYIEQRLGMYSYKTAATIFLISRTMGSAFRLYLVVIVFKRFVFDFYGIPFAMTVLISLALIFAYTYRGGLKTIIITDTLQTFFSSYFGFLDDCIYLQQFRFLCY
jgi:Na+/proline symporter